MKRNIVTISVISENFVWSLILVLFLSFGFNINGQNIQKNDFRYLSPVPGSKLNPPESSIILKMDDAFNTSFVDASDISVRGSTSGTHHGKIVLAEENNTLIFYPDKKFSEDEIVTVSINNLQTVSGRNILPLEYSFKISGVNLNKKRKFQIQEYLSPPFPKQAQKMKAFVDTKLEELPGLPNSFLPDNFPQIKFFSDGNPAAGNIFFSPFFLLKFSSTYLILVDNYGIPLFYRKVPSLGLDFKKQSTDVLSYFDLQASQYYIMDNFYNIIDSISTKNGYGTDSHELVMMKNGHALLMSYDSQQYPMDTVVAGGNPNAVVIGLIIQELDINKNVVFQWRSWDHFKITDALGVSLTDSVIDYVHGNAIEPDYDGNLLISSRHMDEITKIDRQTGEIIWRLAGRNSNNNQFTFLNDSVTFSYQHDIRRLPNGHITLFDNGNLHNRKASRAVEYEIDEVNKTVTQVWEYRNNPQTFSAFMGSTRRLDNQNTIIGWGGGFTPPAITEARKNGTIAQQISFADSVINYRAFKFPWKSEFFTANIDSFSFGYVPLGDSLTMPITVTNNSNRKAEINGFFSVDSAFNLSTELPVTLSPSESKEMMITFKPLQEKVYAANTYFRWDTESEGIALSLPVSGTSDTLSTSVDIDPDKINYLLGQNYPNPFNPSTKISFSIPKHGLVKLIIYDILGKEVKTILNKEMERGIYEIDVTSENLPSGVYMYNLSVNGFSSTKKMIVLK